jgi:hypothetical protein
MKFIQILKELIFHPTRNRLRQDEYVKYRIRVLSDISALLFLNVSSPNIDLSRDKRVEIYNAYISVLMSVVSPEYRPILKAALSNTEKILADNGTAIQAQPITESEKDIMKQIHNIFGGVDGTR